MRLVLLDLTFVAAGTRPSALGHRLDTLVRANPTAAAPSPVAYRAAPIGLDSEVPTLGPPLSGARWTAFNGCCAPGVSHRSTAMPVNGALHFAQRFAIDWMQLDDQGRILHGDPADVHSYTGYDHEVMAVADGTETATRDTLDDQVPGKNPIPPPSMSTTWTAITSSSISAAGPGQGR